MAGRYLNFGEVLLANYLLRAGSRDYHRSWNLSPGPHADVFAGRFFIACDEDFRAFAEASGWELHLYDVYVAFEDGAIARLSREGSVSGWPTYGVAKADLLAALGTGRVEVREEGWLPHLERRWRCLLGDLAVCGLYTRVAAERVAEELIS